MKNINRRLENIEKQLNIDKEDLVVFKCTDENGMEQKIEMTCEELMNAFKRIPQTYWILPCQEEEYLENLTNQKIFVY